MVNFDLDHPPPRRFGCRPRRVGGRRLDIRPPRKAEARPALLEPVAGLPQVVEQHALRLRLGPEASKLILTFQSRFGFDQWLQPYTDKTVAQLAKDGVRRIAVVTPGFSADCLETLEEIAQENAEIFKHNGGEEFSAIPSLNDSDACMDVIRQLVLRELQGWI